MVNTSTPEDKEIDCPLCGKTKINVTITPQHYTYSTARAFGKVKRIPVVHPERIQIHSKCSNCNASKQNIKDALESGTIGKQSHKDLLKRLKESGLPTKIESKH